MVRGCRVEDGDTCVPSSCILVRRMKIPAEYPGEQGQFGPGVNSKRSLQETLEMDCRMEPPPPFISRLFFVTVDFPSSDTGLFAVLMESRAGVKEVLGSIYIAGW